MAAAIVTKGLTKKYGDRVVVDHLDLSVNEGEVFGLLGPNGAGKTTTILMCLGLSEPTSGSATVVGFDPARQPIEVKQVVGYLPDAVGFYEGMTGTGEPQVHGAAQRTGSRRGGEPDRVAAHRGGAG